MDILKKQEHKTPHIVSIIIMLIMALTFFSACSPSHRDEVDELNIKSYAYHYQDLDSVRFYALKALQLSSDYDAGQAEAFNNLAFVSIIRMDYIGARKILAQAESITDNQIEQLIADVQMMRLCQRESRNKEFYVYHERAQSRLKRINEEKNTLSEHLRKRLLYAQSEFNIVTATYYYYVGLYKPFRESLKAIDPDEVEQDTAQYLNYLYNIGSGGAIIRESADEVCLSEFDYLLKCYLLASDRYPFWAANSLQAMSEHLNSPHQLDLLLKNDLPAIKYINTDQMPDHLLAGNLAERALYLFSQYGDVYQTAGANRTLAECYWSIHDYRSAISCLGDALNRNKAISQAPDLVASIREQLSLSYSALNDKASSDYNRNIYLDMQEQTRQDRQLEARAELLNQSTSQLNWMLLAVAVAIVLLCVLLFWFSRLRRNDDLQFTLNKLLEPLHTWMKQNLQESREISDKFEEIDEQIQVAQIHMLANKKRNLEQRAKIQLVNEVTPFIDRMLNEVDRLGDSQESDETKKQRYDYIVELTDKINDYNNVLTQWIQLRQGELNLNIESFKLQDLFDIVKKGRMSFQLKNLELDVHDTLAVVKADKTLTLFMLNTLADNAKKFTPAGGKITIDAVSAEKYVEISVSDTGEGMSEEQVSHIFDRKPILDEQINNIPKEQKSHGFGLLNCKGIIEKYKKVSSLFSVCEISAESHHGKGSTFRFRLPKGFVRFILLLCMVMTSMYSMAKGTSDYGKKAALFADSAYFSNIEGTYDRTLVMADSARKYLNLIYLSQHPKGRHLMVKEASSGVPSEIIWFHDSVKVNYNIILDIRNESAVAALALHKWDLYHYNNSVYTLLFREHSADNTLATYVRTMQQAENSRIVAIVLLILVLLLIPVVSYFLFYRHKIFFKYCVEKVNGVNDILLKSETSENKLKQIDQIWSPHTRSSVTGDVNAASLNPLIDKIRDALKNNIAVTNHQKNQMTLARDELRRVDYENARLHISNSVLENCLSTLKHETMYYPSRIRQLITLDTKEISVIKDVAEYYKELYTLLSAQAMRQIEGNIKYDIDLIHYLFEILNKVCGCLLREAKIVEKDDRYVVITQRVNSLSLTDDQCRLLFTPMTCDIRFLLCKQIIREVGEVTNLRACGIQALRRASTVEIEIIMPKRIWKNLK